MLNLFKIEWMKMKKYRAFWVLFGTFTILYPATYFFVAMKFMEQAPSREEQMLKELLGNPFIFPGAWLSSSWFGGLFFVMIGMLFILLICNEVQYRTHRQNIIDGWSRFDFLKAKFTVLLFFVIISTVLVFICGLWVGSIYSPAHKSMSDGLYYVGYFALMATMYLMVAYVIAILVKRTGLSIIIYFAFVCLVDNLLWVLLTFKGSQAGYFIPLETTDSLVPNPFKPAVLIGRRKATDMSLILVAFAYLVLFGYFIKAYFQKIDLKT
jgi:ABC-2 type transport system permease protein